MANRGKVNIILSIQHVPSGVFIWKNVKREVENSRLIPLFINTIQHDYELPGEISVFRAEKDTKTDIWVPGQEIAEKKLVLAECETIFVRYDDEVDIIPGGVGTGAAGKNAVALGGYGGGAVVTADKNGVVRFGGEGQGGHLIGKEATGQGGAGYGGLVVEGTAGDGFGGDIKRRELSSQQRVEAGRASEAGKPEGKVKSHHGITRFLQKLN
ncbi:hypothetical protein LQW54_006833 [Pestalotiopsis sp. IQ-011]